MNPLFFEIFGFLLLQGMAVFFFFIRVRQLRKKGIEVKTVKTFLISISAITLLMISWAIIFWYNV